MRDKPVHRILLPLMLIFAAGPAYPIALQYSPASLSGVGGLSGLVNLGGCSGVLLEDGVHVVTAAHCVADISTDGVSTTFTPRTGMSAGFYTDNGDESIAVSGVHINPLAAYMFPNDAANFNLLMYDLAVVDLAAPAPADAERYRLDLSTDALAARAPVTIAGWGYGGYPGGIVNGGSRRSATNTIGGAITRITDNTTGQTRDLPDFPIILYWTTSADTNNPANTTGLGNHGDSGGPLLYNGNLIGILAFGDLPDLGEQIAIGQTYINGYTDFAIPGNADFLLATIPEPGTCPMILGAAGLLAIVHRRRARG